MRGARPDAAIEQHIERDGVIRRGERIVVACSGGADSVALAAALAAVRVPMELRLELAYVNHGTRASAWQDECVVLRAGAALGIPVRVMPVDAPGRNEQSLREARYAALLDAARETGANAIATAHHQEDQSETVLLALLRGAGTEGLAGMRARRELTDGVDLVRPLLRIGSEQLRYYCHVHALPYAVDPTNADVEIRRNAVRRALEGLRPLFPGLDAAVARTADVLAEERSQTRRAGLRRQVREALEREAELRDVDFSHVEAVVRTLERGGSGRFHMKAGVELEIVNGAIAGRAPARDGPW
jgi:tRNA(Ile)-lysidine synthase